MIGQLSSDSGLALVVPAYFVCAGILLYTGIVAALLGMYRGRAPLNLSFAATCFFSSMFTFALASYYLSSSFQGGVEALRWTSSAAVLFLLSLLAFVGIYTETPRMKGILTVAALVAATFLAANHFLPLGARFQTVESYSWIHLPWGESLFRLHGQVGPWNVALRAAALLVAGWAIWRLMLLHRRGRRRDAMVLAVYMLVLLAASSQGALIDRGFINNFYYTPLAMMGLAALMTINLGMRMREQNAELRETARQLREENERRREAESRIRERAASIASRQACSSTGARSGTFRPAVI